MTNFIEVCRRGTPDLWFPARVVRIADDGGYVVDGDDTLGDWPFGPDCPWRREDTAPEGTHVSRVRWHLFRRGLRGR